MKMASKFSPFIFPLALLATLSLVFLYPIEFHLQSSFAMCPSASQRIRKTDLRVLVGVFTIPNNYERRHLIRLAYARQSSLSYSDAQVDVFFVFCKLSSEEQKVLVALEISRFNDIIILNCTENMNNGKTYTYFASIPTIFSERSYDYVMKCDDDTYVRLGNLVESLRNKSREDTYYGLVNPCYRANDMDYKMNKSFMSGLGYVLSWDLVEWIAVSDLAYNNRNGPEDIILSAWLNKAKKGQNRYHNFPAIYDYRGILPETCWRHDFIPETIAVHMLKGNSEWAKALDYFNETDGLQPSKFYHIPKRISFLDRMS
ncbi:hypothetical protein LUZ60_007483 [Juncus effusus]|nr:hypothetical protein LUZ60_007483 [Juncus effusus]